MSCKFSIYYPKPKSELVSELERAILKTNGEFYGDTTKGVFEGRTTVGGFSGFYIIDEDTINVTIEKKPFLVSCGRIEDEINNYLNTGTV